MEERAKDGCRLRRARETRVDDDGVVEVEEGGFKRWR